MIKIYRRPHTAFAARLLQQNLQALGVPARVVRRVNPLDPSLHILYHAARVRWLPRHYIVYQTEVTGSAWFSPRYLRTLQRARAVWDYAAANLCAYQYLAKRVDIVSPGVAAQPQAALAAKDIPALFYGSVKKSAGRRRLLEQISRHVAVRVVEDQFEEDIWALLARAQTVLNLHFYPQAPLEAFRINEALSFGCRVISQRSASGDERYTGLVQFADTAEDIIAALQAPPNAALPDLTALDNLLEIKRALEQINP